MTFKSGLILFLVLFVSACASVKSDLPEEKKMVAETDEVHFTADVLPLFGGCKNQACSDKKLIEYLFKRLKYPSEAKKQGIKGKVYVQYVIEKDGFISNIRLLKDLEAGCGEAAMNVVQGMNNLNPPWSPAEVNGKKVRIMYTLPITFDF